MRRVRSLSIFNTGLYSSMLNIHTTKTTLKSCAISRPKLIPSFSNAVLLHSRPPRGCCCGGHSLDNTEGDQQRDNQRENEQRLSQREAEDHIGSQCSLSFGVATHRGERASKDDADANARPNRAQAHSQRCGE